VRRNSRIEAPVAVIRIFAMAQPINAAAVDAAADAYLASISRIIDISPGMYIRRGADGTSVMFTGLPGEIINQVCVAPEPDMGVVEAFAEELSAKDVPWSFLVRNTPNPALLKLAARYSKTPSVSHPLLVWDADLLNSLPEPVAPDATVRELSAGDHELYGDFLVNNFGLPREVANFQARPEVLGAPGITAFVVEVAGEAVGIGFNTISGDYVALSSGAILPVHRRRGYYRALVTARLRHATSAGVRYAITRTTPMSRPLYESLGFRYAETWTYLATQH
jgi:GNAT superfamily N-acetyltransferase